MSLARPLLAVGFLPGLLVVNLALALGLCILLGPGLLSAAPQDYTSEYSSSALYTNQALLYDFSGLDSSTEYTWRVELVNDQDVPVRRLAQWVIGTGDVTGSRNVSFWPSDVDGPVRVIDHWGQVVGRHYLTPAPPDSPALALSGCANAGSWYSTNTVNHDDKTGLADAPYSCVDDNGYQHDDTDPTTVVVAYGDPVLLHYRADSATTDVIRIVDVGDASTIAEYPVQELADYNGGGHSAEDAFRYFSYTVLTTDGDPPLWIDGDKSASVFSADNPHNLVLPAGVYEYARLTSGGSLVAVGESLLVVSIDSAGSEWLMRVNQTIDSAGEQTVRLRAASEAVWDDLDTRTIEDDQLGSQLTVADSWELVRFDRYTVGSVADTIATSSWCFAVASLTWATGSERRLCNDLQYLIRADAGLSPRLEGLLAAWSMNDDLGHLIMFVLGVVLSFVAAGKLLPQRLGKMRFILAYLVLTGAALFSQWLSGWTALVVGFSALLLVILMVMGSLRND